MYRMKVPTAHAAIKSGMSTQTALPSSGEVHGINEAQIAAMPVATRLKDREAVAITAPNISGNAKAVTLKDCNMWLARRAGNIAAKA